VLLEAFRPRRCSRWVVRWSFQASIFSVLSLFPPSTPFLFLPRLIHLRHGCEVTVFLFLPLAFLRERGRSLFFRGRPFPGWLFLPYKLRLAMALRRRSLLVKIVPMCPVIRLVTAPFPPRKGFLLLVTSLSSRIRERVCWWVKVVPFGVQHPEWGFSSDSRGFPFFPSIIHFQDPSQSRFDLRCFPTATWQRPAGAFLNVVPAKIPNAGIRSRTSGFDTSAPFLGDCLCRLPSTLLVRPGQILRPPFVSCH